MSDDTNTHWNKVNTSSKKIICETKKRLISGLDEEAQYELAKILNLIPFFFKYETLVDYLNLLEVSVSSLLTEKPNINFAKAIRIDLEKRSYEIDDDEKDWWSPWKYIRNPSARLLTGLVANVFLALVYGILFFRFWNSNPDAMIFGIDAYKIAVVTIMGMFGGIVSIMLRIRDYDGYRGEYGSTLFFTGFTRPLIGAMFSLFVLTVISSGILPLDYVIIDAQAVYFFSALSFITGFSERFARDLITKTEEVII